MKIISMKVDVAVTDAVTQAGAMSAVSEAVSKTVGVFAVEVRGDGAAPCCASPEEHAKRGRAASKDGARRRYRRRVNANGETCVQRDNGDGTVTETRT